MPVTFRCPKCDQKLTLSASKPGDGLACPRCETAIVAPGSGPSVGALRLRVAAVVVLLAVCAAIAVFSFGNTARPDQAGTGDPPAGTHAPDTIRATNEPNPPGGPNRAGEGTGNGTGQDKNPKKLLFWCGWHDNVNDRHVYFSDKNPLWTELKSAGFDVRIEFNPFKNEWLKETDQLWVVSGPANGGQLPPTAPFQEFVKAGKGLYLIADNSPFNTEANVLARYLYGVTVGALPGEPVKGVYVGRQIAWIDRPRSGTMPRFETDTRYPFYLVDDHPLLTGVKTLFEGETITTLDDPNDKLETILKSSNGRPLVARAKVPGHRVVIDGGFTRYYSGKSDRPAREGDFIRIGSATVFARNVALYLAGEDVPKKKP